MESFNHTDQPLRQLLARDQELYELVNIPHSPERQVQIQHEISCLAVELFFRKQEGEY